MVSDAPQAQEHAADKLAAAAQSARSAAVEDLTRMVEEPRKLWQAAVDIISKFTSATGVYVASIVDEEQPDWSPPEDMENPDAETDDEGPSATLEGDDVEGAAGEEAAGEGETAEAEAEEAAAVPQAQARPEYSRKLLTYVAACSGQEHVCEVELRRPPPPAEDSDRLEAPAQTPVTFRVLDELIPLLEVSIWGTAEVLHICCIRLMTRSALLGR
jgi:hypothetical protein